MQTSNGNLTVSNNFFQNFINAYSNDRINNDALDGNIPSWLPEAILNRSVGHTDDVDNGNFGFTNTNGNTDTNDFGKRQNNNGKIQLKLLCGADLLESFSVPGLWADEDVSELFYDYNLNGMP